MNRVSASVDVGVSTLGSEATPVARALEPERRLLGDPKLLGDQLLALPVVAGNDARDGRVLGNRPRDADRDDVLDAEPLPSRGVVYLDPGRADGDEVARLPGPRK